MQYGIAKKKEKIDKLHKKRNDAKSKSK